LAHQREPTLTSSSSLAPGCVSEMAAQGVTGDLLCLIVRPRCLPHRVPAPPRRRGRAPAASSSPPHPRLALPDRPQPCGMGPVRTARTLSRRLTIARTSPRPRPRLLQRPPRPPTREPARRLCRRTRPQVRPAFLLSIELTQRNPLTRAPAKQPPALLVPPVPHHRVDLGPVRQQHLPAVPHRRRARHRGRQGHHARAAGRSSSRCVPPRRRRLLALADSASSRLAGANLVGALSMALCRASTLSPSFPSSSELLLTRPCRPQTSTA